MSDSVSLPIRFSRKDIKRLREMAADLEVPTIENVLKEALKFYELAVKHHKEGARVGAVFEPDVILVDPDEWQPYFKEMSRNTPNHPEIHENSGLDTALQRE